jgi:maleamate amidohydrolase
VGSALPRQQAEGAWPAAESLYERGIGHTIGFGENPALLIVDFVRAFTDPGKPLGADLESELEETVRVLDEARARALPIFFTAIAYEDPGLADAGIWARKIPAQRTLRAGTPEVELDPRLARRGSEPLLYRKHASAFFGTDLPERLSALRVDTLLLAGCTTSGCVRASAVDGLQHGFRVMVIREAVGDRLQAAHDQSLFDMGAKYADVVSVDEVLDYLRAGDASVGVGARQRKSA